MRFQDAFFTMQGERKRQRTPNSRFQNDYVALPGLRTTAKSTWEHRSHKGKWSHGERSMANECTELTVDESCFCFFKNILLFPSVWVYACAWVFRIYFHPCGPHRFLVQRSQEGMKRNLGLVDADVWAAVRLIPVMSEWAVWLQVGEEVWSDSLRGGEQRGLCCFHQGKHTEPFFWNH